MATQLATYAMMQKSLKQLITRGCGGCMIAKREGAKIQKKEPGRTRRPGSISFCFENRPRPLEGLLAGTQKQVVVSPNGHPPVVNG
jgi:hypothetical protein